MTFNIRVILEFHILGLYNRDSICFMRARYRSDISSAFPPFALLRDCYRKFLCCSNNKKDNNAGYWIRRLWVRT